VLLDPRPDLEIPVGVEELGGHRDELRHLAVIVLKLEDLRVPLEVVEIVDRAQRKLTLQVPANDSDLRFVECRVIEELLPLWGELAVGRQGDSLENAALLVGQIPDRVVRLVDRLVRGHFAVVDLDVRGERLDRQ
jgi:hypothetical protein